MMRVALVALALTGLEDAASAQSATDPVETGYAF